MAIYRGIPCSTQAGGSRGARRRTPRRWMRSSMGGRRGDEALPGFRGLLARALAQGPGPRGPRPPTDPQSNPEGPTRDDHFAYFAGFRSNDALQPDEQKTYVLPPKTELPAARFGSTIIPHTG